MYGSIIQYYDQEEMDKMVITIVNNDDGLA